MKNVIFSLLVSLITLTTFAQSKSPHLLFKGIPIDGTYNSFVTKLKQKGYKQDLSDYRILTGSFAGFSDCKIVVQCDTDKDLVYGVGVIFQATNSWQLLYNSYLNLKKMLKVKYGEPSSEVEEFQHPYSADDDNSKIHEVKMGRSNFKTVFANKHGQIGLFITELNHMICYVTLLYVDNQNMDILQGNAIDDL